MAGIALVTFLLLMRLIACRWRKLMLKELIFQANAVQVNHHNIYIYLKGETNLPRHSQVAVLQSSGK